MNNHITFYLQQLNLKDASFSRIEHEDAMIAIVYKITRKTGEQNILKICTRAKQYFREMYFLNYFGGILPVPRIIQNIRPEPGIDGAVLMECLKGRLLTKYDITNEIAYELGSLLARIHLNRVSGYGDLTQPNAVISDPRTDFTTKFHESLLECVNHLPKTLIDQCQHYYETHVDLLLSADGPCMTHRDFRPGNILIHEGKIQGIIDWARGCASFAEEDFCSLEHDAWLANRALKDSFLAGYACIRPVPSFNAIMPLLRLNQALTIVGFTVKRGTWQNIHSEIYTYNRRYLETFFKIS